MWSMLTFRAVTMTKMHNKNQLVKRLKMVDRLHKSKKRLRKETKKMMLRLSWFSLTKSRRVLWASESWPLAASQSPKISKIWISNKLWPFWTQWTCQVKKEAIHRQNKIKARKVTPPPASLQQNSNSRLVFKLSNSCFKRKSSKNRWW